MIGVVILAHSHLDRTAAVAKHLASEGCAVAIHVDQNARKSAFERLRADVSSEPLIAFCPRFRCEWGRFSLVEAALAGVEVLLREWPTITHATLISGSCLPVRPIAELEAFLAGNRGVDFIESVSLEEEEWVKGGLSIERFTLYFPFSWKRQRRLFDGFVELQRKLGVRRQMPAGLKPYVGSQWWTLSRETLEGILQDPMLEKIKRFFRSTWIPDESFFQTLARRHGGDVRSAQLTFVKFDSDGKPHIFYDDHEEVLLNVDAFFARKIWPGASGLYRRFLSPDLAEVQPATRTAVGVERALNRATKMRTRGRVGLINQNRYTSRWFEPVFATARSYYVFDGFDRIYPDFLESMRSDSGIEMHGYLFAPDRIEFFGDAEVYAGNLTSSVAHRDYHPDQFLVNLIWGRRQYLQGFMIDLGREDLINAHILRDPNAQILYVENAWMIDAFRRGEGDPDKEIMYYRLFQRQAERLSSTFEWDEVWADIHRVWIPDLVLRPVWTAGFLQSKLPPASDLKDALRRVELPEGFGDFLDRVSASGYHVPDEERMRQCVERLSQRGEPQLIRTI